MILGKLVYEAFLIHQYKAQANSRKLLTFFCVLFLCSPHDELGTRVWELALGVFIPQKMFGTKAFQVIQNAKKHY